VPFLQGRADCAVVLAKFRGAVFVRQSPAAHALVPHGRLLDSARGVAAVVELRLLSPAARSVQRFADKPRALRAQPFDLGSAGPAIIEDTGLFREFAALNLARPKDKMPVIVSLVPLCRRSVQGRDHRHAPPGRDGLGVLHDKLPARRKRQGVRQRHDDLAADGRVLPGLRLVHEPRKLARRPRVVEACAAKDTRLAAVIVGFLKPRINGSPRRDVGDLCGRAVALRARVRLQVKVVKIFAHKDYSSVWRGPVKRPALKVWGRHRALCRACSPANRAAPEARGAARAGPHLQTQERSDRVCISALFLWGVFWPSGQSGIGSARCR
jgi:hypothetical protein